MKRSAATAEAPPAGYVLYHRDGSPRSRWKRVAESRTRGEVVARMSGPGEWWVAEIRDPALLRPETRQPTLFD